MPSRDEIAKAIAGADVGFNMTLIRLVDGISTYRLNYNFGESLEFSDDDEVEGDEALMDVTERLYAHVARTKRQRQADAILKLFTPAPLEWDHDDEAESFIADTSLGRYWVRRSQDGQSWLLVRVFQAGSDVFQTIMREGDPSSQEAIDAANKHYQEMVLSLLGGAPA